MSVALKMLSPAPTGTTRAQLLKLLPHPIKEDPEGREEVEFRQIVYEIAAKNRLSTETMSSDGFQTPSPMSSPMSPPHSCHSTSSMESSHLIQLHRKNTKTFQMMTNVLHRIKNEEDSEEEDRTLTLLGSKIDPSQIERPPCHSYVQSPQHTGSGSEINPNLFSESEHDSESSHSRLEQVENSSVKPGTKGKRSRNNNTRTTKKRNSREVYNNYVYTVHFWEIFDSTSKFPVFFSDTNYFRAYTCIFFSFKIFR